MFDGERVGSDERHVDMQDLEELQRVRSHRGLRDAPHAAADQVKLHGGKCCEAGGDGYGIGRDGEFGVGGQGRDHPAGRGAGVEDDASAGGREVCGRCGGDPVLLVGPRVFPVRQCGFGDRQGREGNRAAVDPAYVAESFEQCEVPSHGFGGDAVPIGERGHGHASSVTDQVRYRLLAFLRVHPHSFEAFCCFMLFYARLC